MKLFLRPLCGFLLFAVIAIGPGSAPVPAAEADLAEIQRLIRQLGSDKFEDREAASKRLEAIGVPALEPLRKAAESDDVEIRERAGKLVDVLERGLAGAVRDFAGHSGLINDAVFSADGGRVASASWDRTVRVWDVETGKELRRFEGHVKFVTCVAFAKDGRRLLSGGGDNAIYLWDADSGKSILRLDGHDGVVQAVTFTSDGRNALSAAHDSTIRLWDLATGKEVRSYKGHKDPVWCLALSPDGRRLLSGGGSLFKSGRGGDCAVRLWDVDSGRELCRLEGHTRDVRRVAFSPDGRLALSGGFDKSVRLWDLETAKEVRRFEGHTDFVESVCFTPDGKLGVSCSGADQVDGKVVEGTDHSIRVWDLETGKQLHRIAQKSTGPLYKLELSPDGRQLLTGSSDKTVRLWRMPTPK